MRMTLTLLFMSDFWLGIINLKNANRLKKDINEELMNVVQHPKSQHLGHMKTCFSSKSLAQKFVDSFSKQYIIWEYQDILALKVIHEDLL